MSRAIYCNAHVQQNDLSAMAGEKKMVHDLLDFKASLREFCDHSYFRDLTGDKRRLPRSINLDS